MLRALRELDRILRGDATDVARLENGSLDVSVPRLLVMVVVLGALYGLCMGSFAVFRHNEPDYQYEMQLLATSIKVPTLFLLTLVVTFPSLYVFNALVGSRLTLLPVLRLLVASLGVILAVLSSLGPIVAFFGVSTTSYSFMVLLNVVAFAAAGFLGLLFLLQTLNRLTRSREMAQPIIAKVADPNSSSATTEPLASAWPPPESSARLLSLSSLDRVEGHVLSGHVKTVFYCWVVLFGFVGAQMGWVLRPFIGSPNAQFTWFREREGNFFESVSGTILHLLRGEPSYSSKGSLRGRGLLNSTDANDPSVERSSTEVETRR